MCDGKRDSFLPLKSESSIHEKLNNTVQSAIYNIRMHNLESLERPRVSYFQERGMCFKLDFKNIFPFHHCVHCYMSLNYLTILGRQLTGFS